MKAHKVSIVIAALTVGPVMAQDTALGRAIELPAHRALFAVLDSGAELAPFTTDGCSGGLSESWTLVADWFPEFAEAHDQRPPWEACCVTHDRAYHNVGDADSPDSSYAARLAADENLRSCVRATGQDRQDEIIDLYDVSAGQVTAAYDAIAGSMYIAVRFGGGPCSGLPWRWGYGYPQCSVFTTPTKTD